MAAPKPPPMPTGLAKGATDYLKKNWRFAYAGGVGLAFLGLDLKNILDSDNKLKALLKTFKDFVLIRVAMIGVFTGIRDAMRGLVRETGSLDAALRKLSQIQQYARQFQAFTGGINSAKQRIAELNQLAQRKPFKFEDIVEANKSLEIYTRGAYSSVEATKTIGEAALASGNSIGDTAKAVGIFYDQLRNGKPVGEAAEQLRQMNLISGSTADDLTKMSESGADVNTTFGALTDTLKKTAEGAAGYKDELAGVTAEHEKAVEALKVAFGAPWTKDDIQSSRNMTEAWKAITPTIAALSKQLATLFNGLSTLSSWFFKVIAQSSFIQKAFSGIVQAVMVASVALGLFGLTAVFPLIAILFKLSTVVSQFAFVGLSQLTGNLAMAARAAKTLQIALSGLGAVSVILLAVGFVATLAGAVIKAHQEAKEADKAFHDWKKALEESTAAILEQIAAVTTLASKYEALGKVIDKLSDLQNEFNALQDRHKHIVKEQAQIKGTEGQFWHPNIQELKDPTTARRLQKEKEVNEAQQKQIKLKQEILKQAEEELAIQQPLHEGLLKQEATRRFAIEQAGKGAAQREEEARQGTKVAADVEDKKSKIVADRMAKEKALQDLQIAFSGRTKRTPDDIKRHQDKEAAAQEVINNLKLQEQKIGLDAPEFSFAHKQARSEQLQNAKRAVELQAELNAKKGAAPEEKRRIQTQLTTATQLAGGEKAVEEYRAHPAMLAEAQIQAEMARQKEAAPPSPEEARAARVTELTTRAETKAEELRRRGQVASAQGVEDMLSFTKSFESMRGSLGDQKASSVALAKTQEDIAQEYVPASHIVSSMQAVGGGGEVSQVDPQLDSARRREQLQSRMVDLLGILAGQQPEQPSQPTFAK